jgi:hypothetical protein
MLKTVLLITALLFFSINTANACMVTNADGSIASAEDLQAMCGEGKYFDDTQCTCLMNDGSPVPVEPVAEDVPASDIICDGRTKENTKCFAGYYFSTETCKCARYEIR